MPIRTSTATWEGNLNTGKGQMKLGSGAFDGPFSFATRWEEEPGTNPEELIGAAHAGCFSMALSAGLGRAGFTPVLIQTTAKVQLGKVDGKSRITLIELECSAEVPGIGEDQFLELAEATKVNCPVSAALAAVETRLNARLI